jgi:hypothetical protein
MLPLYHLSGQEVYMKKILVKKPFHLNKIGLVPIGSELNVNDATAEYAVRKMKAAEYIKESVTKKDDKKQSNKKNNKK